MNTKSIFLSKTFWLQVVAVVAMTFPQVQSWLAENPVELVAVFAALNVLVRFATSGKVNIFAAGEAASKLPVWVVLGAAVGMLGALPSCSPGSEYPITGSFYLRDPGSGAKAGLSFSPGASPAASIRVPLYDKDTGDLIGMTEVSLAPQAIVIAEK